MAYTAPRTWVTNEVVTAALMNVHLRDNMKVAYDAPSTLRGGSGFHAAPTMFNTPSQDFTNADSFLVSGTDAAVNGTPQARVVTQVNVTVAGPTTSFAVKVQGLVQGASGNSAVVGTTIPIYSPAAIAGTLTSGWKYFDSGWHALSALATNISAYGIAEIRPRWEIDWSGGVAPTLANFSAQIFTRIA